MDSDSIPSGLDPIAELAEQYLRRRRSGERPTAGRVCRESTPSWPRRSSSSSRPSSWSRRSSPRRTNAPARPATQGKAPEVVDAGDCAQRLGDYTLFANLGRAEWGSSTRPSTGRSRAGWR